MKHETERNYSSVISIQNKYSTAILPVVLGVVDYLAVLAAVIVSGWLRDSFMGNTNLHLSWLSIHVIIPAVYLLFMQAHGLYTRRTQFWRVIAEIFKVNAYAMVSLVLIMYLLQSAANTSRLFAGLLWILAFLFLVIGRYGAKKVLSRLHCLQIPVLVMGAGKTAALVLDHLCRDAGLGYTFIGFLEDKQPEPHVAAMMPNLGTFADAEDVIRRTGVQHVLIVAPGIPREGVQELVYRLQPQVKNVAFIPDMSGMPLATLDMESLIDGHIVAFKFRNNLAQWYNQVLKRLFDLVCTSIGIICLSPVLLAIAVWIYKDSPGPVIFKHRRVGKGGREFSCYKFRSMCVDADVKLKELLEKDPQARKEWETEFKLKNDPRITRSGAFLRKTSLDELPQLFNVLKGEMSLVGPRPIIRDEVKKYGKFIEDFYMVRPGVTGMWQTSGRNDVSYDERVQMDTWYVRNWNLWFDIVLIWRTISVVLKRKGAY
ncbi:sugar transferase [uncultured Megasphaera sp.]|uniref:sugar transferase n=1 Tax=uncultured Megasphaera sp. TaxID=165188 RepID=UPI0026580B00|nr:sugar transferase [uncultured Megasphaera sp.]